MSHVKGDEEKLVDRTHRQTDKQTDRQTHNLQDGYNYNVWTVNAVKSQMYSSIITGHVPLNILYTMVSLNVMTCTL